MSDILTTGIPTPKQPLTISFEGKEFHTGYSRLSKYITCPKQYKFVYVDGRRHESSGPMNRGSAYHSALEFALEFKLQKGRELSLPKLIDMSKFYSEQLNLTESVVTQVAQAAEFWHKQLYPTIEPLFVEKLFTIVRGGVKMTLRIDCGTTTGETIDHKFSYDLWSNARAKNSTQPIIYQWAWEDVIEAHYGVPYKRFEYHILRTFPGVNAQRLKLGKVNALDSKSYEEHIREVAESMCAGIYFRRPDTVECGRCKFRKECKPVFYRVSAETFGEADLD